MELGHIYKKTNETSYALGASLTYELLIEKSSYVKKVYFHCAFMKSNEYDKFITLCDKNNISHEINDRAINRLSRKENCFVIGEFIKYDDQIDTNTNHLVLVNPANMGNLGTIIRTASGFDINDIVIIKPGVDIFDPKVIRASMGALFHIRFSYYETFDDYLKIAAKRELFTFRLNSENILQPTRSNKYSLIFGNEASGLSAEFDHIGTGIRIDHNTNIDSLSLPIAVGIALFAFKE